MDEYASATPAVGRGIVLIGYRATGKTTVGRIVADRIGRAFHDCDSQIESRSGRDIRHLFVNEGEAAFRDWEEKTIREVCRESPGAVLATGGGAILRDANRVILDRFGLVVWLTAPAEILVERLRNDPNPRPSLTEAGLLNEVETVLKHREPIYRSAAHRTVDASIPDPSEVAEQVIQLWNSWNAQAPQ